jgi:hypothetical protein
VPILAQISIRAPSACVHTLTNMLLKGPHEIKTVGSYKKNGNAPLIFTGLPSSNVQKPKRNVTRRRPLSTGSPALWVAWLQTEPLKVGGQDKNEGPSRCGQVMDIHTAKTLYLYHRERILETSTLSCNEEEEEITKPPKR